MSRDALVIGINQYRHKQLNHLTSPATDAEAIAQILEKHGYFSTVRRLPEVFKDGAAQVNPNGQVTRKQLREAIAQLFNPKTKTQMPDTALLYFSGHGWQSGLNVADGYLALSDADPEEDLGVELQWLRSQLEQSEIKQQVIWLDCCNSGNLLNFDSVISAQAGKVRDRCFITSSRDFEASYQNPGSAYSVLTEALLAGLDPNTSDTGEVTNHTLAARLEQALKGQIQGFRYHSTGGSILLTSGSAARTPPAVQPWEKRGISREMTPEQPVEQLSKFTSISLRVALFKNLSSLPSPLFEQLLFALDPPPGTIPSTYAPQGDRVKALLDWATSIGPGLGEVEVVYNFVINPR